MLRGVDIMISRRNDEMADKKNKKQVHIRDVKASDVQNPGLKKALETLKENRNPQNEQAMFKELSTAHLLLPVHFKGGPGNLQIQFVLVHTNDGRSFFPAFTDEGEAEKLKMPEGSKKQYLVRTMQELDLLFKDSKNKTEGVVINPMSANIILPRNLIHALATAKQKAEEAQKMMSLGQIPAGMEVRFVEPRIYPTAMVNAVHDACMEIPEISQVYFKQMLAGGAVGFALIVRTDDGRLKPETAQTLKDTATPLSKNVEVTVLNWSKDLGEKVLKEDVPLYDRELGL